MVAISLYRGNLHRVTNIPRRWLMPSPQISIKQFKSLLHRRSKSIQSLKQTVHESDSLASAKVNYADKVSDFFVDPDISLENKHTQIEMIGGVISEKEKRRKEVEEKLQVLNAKKHNLVLALKQILNVEEELKRRSSEQGIALRSCVQFQVDGTNDGGSLTRHVTPRAGSEGNVNGGDVEGSETDDPSNHNMYSRNVHLMSNISSSGVHHNMGSRFALSHQGNGMNQGSVSVCVSGTGYIASSPSPAASGGTSVFKDAPHPSPWN